MKLSHKYLMFVDTVRLQIKMFFYKGLSRDYAISCVGSGWKQLVNNLYDAKPKGVYVLQVKQKWGGLRFYVSSAPSWYFDLIEYYEAKSERTCEVCGRSGIVRNKGWVETLCDVCYNGDERQST